MRNTHTHNVNVIRIKNADVYFMRKMNWIMITT